MHTIEKIIDHVLKVEGEKYTNHPSDRGGPTKWGITQATLSTWRKRPVSADEVKLLTETEARAIYYNKYVEAPGFNLIYSVSPAIAAELVDTGVNTGPGKPSLWLQMILNGLNRQQKDYPDIEEDGDVGAATLNALKRLLAKRGKEGEKAVLNLLDSEQGHFYLAIARGRQANEDFLFGWAVNRLRP